MYSFDLYVRLLFNQFPPINKFSWITVLPYPFRENVVTEYCFGSKYIPPYFPSLPGMHPLICSTPKTSIFWYQFHNFHKPLRLFHNLTLNFFKNIIVLCFNFFPLIMLSNVFILYWLLISKKSNSDNCIVVIISAIMQTV